MDSVKFRLEGVAPLIMHNSRGADPLNEYAKRLKEVTKKRAASDAFCPEIEKGSRWGDYVRSLGVDDGARLLAALENMTTEWTA